MGQKNIASGSYAIIYIGTLNIMKIICVLSISLRSPTYSGGYYFMNKFSGK